MKEVTASSWYANIWIAGDPPMAVAAMRRYCDCGLCVTVTLTTFVYTRGVETGVCVRLIQYPRFPKPISVLREQAIDAARYLIAELSQWSATVEMPDDMIWITNRPEDKS